MNRILISMFVLSLAVAAGAPRLARSASHPAQPRVNTVQQTDAASDKPNYDIKAEALVDEEDLAKKFTSLADATPAAKFTWRPAEGVRSIGEVYLHVAQSNYGILKYSGATIPEGKDAKTFERSTTDKAKIIAELKQSFDWVHQNIGTLSNADLAQPVKELGPEANKGDVLFLLATHGHEHLGQSIAYARVNGVIPPWTKARMDKDKDKKKTAGDE